jgi:hypothetical protein
MGGPFLHCGCCFPALWASVPTLFGKLPFGAEQSASETDLPELVLGAGVAVPILYLTQHFKPVAGVHLRGVHMNPHRVL